MLNPSDHSRILTLLRGLNCSAGDAELYLHCLTGGPGTVQEIARKLKRNRITVHSAIQRMTERGLFYETRKGKKRLVGAEQPQLLSQLIQRKKNELQVMEANTDYVIQLLSTLQHPDSSVPTVKLYEDVDGFKKMLEESLEAEKFVFVFTYVDLFSRLIDPDYLENYFKRRAAKGIHTRLIFPPCPFAERVQKKAKEYKIQIRLLPPGLKWSAGIFSWNDKISIKSFTAGKLTCTIIQNKDIADFWQKVVFELCWSVAKPAI